MSRIGRMPIAVPGGVDVTIDGRAVTVKGPKGTLSHTLAEPITIGRADDGALIVERPDDERASKALHGLSRTLVANMVIGVTDGYVKTLEIVGTGYRVQARLGSRVRARVQPPGAGERARGCELRGRVADSLHGVGHRQAAGRPGRRQHPPAAPPDPYKGKGVRYQGEQVRRKAGKAGK